MGIGKDAERIINAALERGLPIPSSFESPPQIHEELLFYWNAFADLTTCRPVSGFGISRIPWIAVKQYADHHHILDQDAFMEFNTIIQGMDTCFIAILDLQREAKEKNAGQSNQDRGRPQGRHPRR